MLRKFVAAAITAVTLLLLVVQFATMPVDSGVLPTTGCNGNQERAEITRNDDLGLYLMVFVCNPSSTLPTTPPERFAAWYYSTATSLELQDWSEPQLIVNSERALTSPYNSAGGGVSFDGYYPSLMSPGSPAGHTQLTGRVFFMNGCDTGSHVFTSRKFTIATEPE